MEQLPAHAIRATDAEREQAAERLRRAAGDGQLTADELDERLEAAYAARTRGDLEPLTVDLQAAATSSAGFSVRPGEGGDHWLVSVMGGSNRRGRWRMAASCTALSIMGGSEIDLNDVELASEDPELTVVAIMGGSTVRVPHGMAVEVSEFAVMGGNDIDVAVKEEVVASGGPVLRLRIISIMGGTDVKRGRKLSRAERRELKRREREQRRLERS